MEIGCKCICCGCIIFSLLFIVLFIITIATSAIFAGPGAMMPGNSIRLDIQKDIISSLKSDDFSAVETSFKYPNAGLIVPENISFEAEELVLALSKIVAKIPKNRKIKYLNNREVYELENSNSESYRLNLNNKS